MDTNPLKRQDIAAKLWTPANLLGIPDERDQ
jgi:hypothetical protein